MYKMGNYSILWTDDGEKRGFDMRGNDAEIVRLLKGLIISARKGFFPKMDGLRATARRQWDDGTHETIINVYYKETDIYFFTSIYNCRTQDFEYVSEIFPA